MGLFAQFTLLIGIISFTIVKASYDIPSSLVGVMENRAGSGSFVLNNTLYTYGGGTYQKAYSNIFSAISIADDGQVVYKDVYQHTPGILCGRPYLALLEDQQTVYSFTGRYPGYTRNNTLLVMRYSFQDENPSWVQILPVNNETWPSARRYTSGVLAPNGKIYFYGGYSYRTDLKLNDFYSFDPTTNHFTNLTIPGLMYTKSHIGVALPNGLIVYVTGYCTKTVHGSSPMPYNRVLLYDTSANRWEYKNTSGDKFSERTLASGILGPDKKTIFMFGGSNPTTALENEEEDATLYNDIFMLDTWAWTWKKLNTRGYLPIARNSAVMGFISNDTLLVGFGQAITTYISDLNVLRMDSKISDYATWLAGPGDFLSNDLTQEITGTNLSKGAIAGIVIGSIGFVIFLGLCIWKIRENIGCVIYHFSRKVMWVPRSGEPFWAEGCRLAFRFVILVLLLFFFGFTIKEIVNSDKAIMTIRTESFIIQTPDIRFCFDGWDNGTDVSTNLRPRVICSTDESYDCSKFLTDLNMSIHQPEFSDRFGDVYCSLYSPPSWFSLTNSKGKGGNGTILLFSFYGDPDTDGAIHTTFYPPGKNPNVNKFNIETTDIASLVTEKEMESWIVLDLEDRYARNIHTIAPRSVSTLSYQLKECRYITNDKWNNIGFMPIYNKVQEVETVFRAGVQSDHIQSRGDTHISNFKIFPDDYAIIVLQEKKLSTLLNVLGSVGGVISLAVAIQVWLFGFRPNSPWGIIHRWSVGPMRISVKDSLHSRFNSLYTLVPFVNPVRPPITELPGVNEYSFDKRNVTETRHIDYDIGIYQQQRITQLEERMELTEQLLKSYYVDDEIFRELDTAIKQKHAMNCQSNLPLEESQQNIVELRQRLLPRNTQVNKY
ncbi:hypothetical protein CLU79DRAFT_886464 [Phycomyces nitens]|nr:hypothetical protein CLU79DRAFT_886464 [Phycomyces nitens]